MSESQVLDFKPRARGMVIGNIPWLARIADKARAKARGRLGDYVYPCPADRRFLEEVQMAEQEFTALVAECAGDDALIARMKEHLAQIKKT